MRFFARYRAFFFFASVFGSFAITDHPRAAGPFDGAWSGNFVEPLECENAGAARRGRQITGSVNLTIANSAVSAEVKAGVADHTWQATVPPDGTLKTSSLNGKFTGNTFAGTMTLQNGCSVPITLKRS